jgi:prepilin-type processing-associated H-X9-DG protein
MGGYQWSASPGDVQRARVSTRKRHTGKFAIVFIDGHVTAMKPSTFFGQDDAALQKFNTDHKPHREYLPAGGWPLITD